MEEGRDEEKRAQVKALQGQIYPALMLSEK